MKILCNAITKKKKCSTEADICTQGFIVLLFNAADTISAVRNFTESKLTFKQVIH